MYHADRHTGSKALKLKCYGIGKPCVEHTMKLHKNRYPV